MKGTILQGYHWATDTRGTKESGMIEIPAKATPKIIG